MEKHFVTFFSPGTFVAEETTREIASWDVNAAIEMSKGIVERYDARPYAFRFTTRARGEQDFDSKETARSGLYYLSGRILTVEDVEAQNDPANETLLANMRGNGWRQVVQTDTPWRWTQPLRDGDTVLEIKG